MDGGELAVLRALGAQWLSQDVGVQTGHNLLHKPDKSASGRTAQRQRWSNEQRSAQLHRALTAEPVEDGRRHPCEDALFEAADDLGAEVDVWCIRLIADARGDADRASLIRLFGRVGVPKRLDARRVILQRALAAASVEVRDAALQAAESWADAALVPVLRDHREPIAWLEDYRTQVIEDLRP